MQVSSGSTYADTSPMERAGGGWKREGVGGRGGGDGDGGGGRVRVHLGWGTVPNISMRPTCQVLTATSVPVRCNMVIGLEDVGMGPG